MPLAGHAHRSNKAVIAALCLALSAVPLAACSGQKADDAADGGASAPSAQAAVDLSSWKTLGDALAAQTESMSAGWDDNYYVTVFRAGDSVVRVVAKMTPEASEKIDAMDWTRDDIDQQLIEAAGALELVSAEDITDQVLSQEELDKFVGKTGQDLVDAGWTFANYFMYGGKETAATFENGSLAYSFTFDVTTPEDATEDEGASVMGATITQAEFQGPADSATDPTTVE